MGVADLLSSPQVIFRGGEGALQVLPPLLGVVPEARLNLAIYHLRHGMLVSSTPAAECQLETVPLLSDNLEEAYSLIKDLEPSSPQEYILKAVANTVIGQEHGSVSDYTLSVYLLY